MPSMGSIWFSIEVKLDSLRNGITEAQKQISEIDSSFQKSMSSVSKGFENAGKTIGKAGKTLTAAVSLPIAGAGVAAVKAAGDFESMGYTFQAVSGATSEQMAKMSQLAKELGNDITLPGTSATDAAAAMTELAKAGLSIDDTFKAAKATLQLSAAAQIDNAEAATIVGQALNAFGMTGDKAIQVADLLANSANASAGEITDMAYALQAGASVANMAGQNIQDFTTAISLMANAGVTGSDAGTSLKSMFMALISPTDKAAKTMKQYGIDVYDANGKLKPLPELVKIFSNQLGVLSDEQRNAALATIFGSDAIRAANIVLVDGADKWDGMSQAVNKAGGAQDVAASKMKGFNGSMEAFKSTVETLGITIGEKLLPKITPLIGKLTDLVGKFDSLSPSMQDNIIKYGALAAATGPALIALGGLASSVSKVVKGVGDMAKVATSVVNFGGTIVKGIAGIPEGLDTLYLKALYAKDAIGNFATKIGEGATAVFNFGKNLAGDVINGISNFGSKVGEAATAVGKFAVNLAVDAWKALSGFAVQLATTAWSAITSFVTAMGGAIASAWSFTAALLANPITWIVAAIIGLIAAIVLLWKNWDSVSAFLQKSWTAIKGVAGTVFNGIKDILSTVWNTIKNVATSVWNGITGFLNGVWNGIKNTASSVWNGVKTAIMTPINTIKGLLSGVWNGITSTASDAWNGLKNTASNIFNKVKDAILSPFKNLHIPLPHFKFSSKQVSVAGIKFPVPDVDIDWYKTGGIFTQPSVIGVGEAGAEAVVPLDQLTGIVRNALKQVGGVTNQQNAPLLYIENMSVRNDQDIDKLSQAMYNQNMKVMRAMGRKSI